MLVYGDHDETVDTRTQTNVIHRFLEEARTLPPGMKRHSKLVAALIEAGRLLQGLGS